MSPEEIASEDWSADAVKDSICGFVGALYQEHDLDQVNLEEPVEEFTGQIHAKVMAEALDDMDLEPIRESMRHLANIVRREIIEINFESIFASVQEHYLEVEQALEDGINGFEVPADYDPSEASVNSRAQHVGVESLAAFLRNLDDSNEDALDGYISELIEDSKRT
jgi:hypothetical protein